MSEKFRFKLKEKPSDEDVREESEVSLLNFNYKQMICLQVFWLQPKSKYFKPGNLFGSSNINNDDKKIVAISSKANDSSFLDDDDDQELNDLLIEASQLLSHSSAPTSTNALTQSNKSIQKSFIPSLKNSNYILGLKN